MVEHLKDLLVLVSGLTRDSLHIQIGLAVFFLCALILRVPLSSWQPLACVIALETINELLDIRRDLMFYSRVRWSDSVHDLLNTTLWPVAIFLMVRWGIVFRRQ
jgi:hypothetical protein